MAWKQSITVLGSSSTVLTATFSPAVAPGQSFMFMYGWGDATVDTAVFSDNASGGPNVYTKLGALISVGGELWSAAYCANVQGSPTTITMTTSTSHGGAIMGDVYDGGWTFFASSNTGPLGIGLFSPPAITPPVNGCLIYGVAVNTHGTGITQHAGNGFNARITNFSSAWSSEDLTQTSAASISATFDSNDQGVAFEMVFSPTVAGPISIGAGSPSSSPIVRRVARVINT